MQDPLDTWLTQQIQNCSRDEKLVLAVRMYRMAKARPQYGALDIASDRRDYRLEAALEGADRGFYDDCRYIAEKDPAITAFLVELAEANKHAGELPEPVATYEIRDGKAWEVTP